MYLNNKFVCNVCNRKGPSIEENGTVFGGLIKAHQCGWDWVTLLNKPTYHICPKCKVNYPEMFKDAFQLR